MNWSVKARLRSSCRVVVLSCLISILFTATCWSAEPPITALAFSADAANVVVGSQTGVRVLAWPKLEPSPDARLEVEMERVHDARFSPDGKLLAIAGGNPASSGRVEVWNWNQRKRVVSFEVSDDVVYAIDWSKSGERLICGCSQNHLSIVDLASGGALRVDGHSKSVFAVAALGGEHGWLSAGADRSFRWWRKDVGANEAASAPRRTLNNHTGEVAAIALRPGEAALPMVATAGKDGTVRLWQPTIGRLVRFARLPSHPLAIAWTPDGSLLAAACRDGKVRIIDPDTVEVLHAHAAVDSWAYSLAAAPDGSGFAVGGPNGQLHRLPARGYKGDSP